MHRVLIIEDSLFIRGLLKENLEELEMEVIEETGEATKGIELFRQLKPDITLLDYSLPQTSGIEVAEELLAIDIYAHIILMIPVNMLPRSQELISMGFKAVIGKPFYPEKLQSTLIEVVVGI